MRPFNTKKKKVGAPENIELNTFNISWIWETFSACWPDAASSQKQKEFRAEGSEAHQTERAPWSRFAKEGNDVFINASRRGRNAGRVVSYSETGCNNFSLSCGEVRREISENWININNLIRLFVKQSWGPHVNQNIIYQLLEHIYRLEKGWFMSGSRSFRWIWSLAFILLFCVFLKTGHSRRLAC